MDLRKYNSNRVTVCVQWKMDHVLVINEDEYTVNIVKSILKIQPIIVTKGSFSISNQKLGIKQYRLWMNIRQRLPVCIAKMTFRSMVIMKNLLYLRVI